MNMLCSKCSEPWDWFYIRDKVLEDQTLYERMEKQGGFVVESDGLHDSYDPQAKALYLLPKSRSAKIMTDKEAEETSQWQFNPGPTIAQCPACIGKDIEPDDNAKIRASLAHLYGDDIDGFMADMEDFGLE